jgi:hypothetical protein
MNEAEAFYEILTTIRERRMAQEDVVMLTIRETFSAKSPSAMFERGRLTVFEELDQVATRIKIDCDYCSASGVAVGDHKCPSCDGRGWNNPVEHHHPLPFPTPEAPESKEGE